MINQKKALNWRVKCWRIFLLLRYFVIIWHNTNARCKGLLVFHCAKFCNIIFQGTVSVISNDPSCKNGYARFTIVYWNLNLIKKEDIVVFMSVYVVNNSSLLFKNNGMRKLIYAKKPQMKIYSLKKQNHWYLIRTWSDKAFKGTVVNRALTSLHGGLLEIMLTIL